MRGANVLSVALLGQAVAWGAAAGGEGLLVVADEQQLRVSRISEAPATDGGLGVRAVASRRTGVPIESVSICRWNARPHVVLVVSRPEGSTVRIYRVQNGAVAAAFADLRIEYPTRKAQIADVDGDSLAELVVSVSKKTRRDPTVRLRPFVYQWSGVSWVPKWLGSRLGYDLVDFTCVPAAGGDRLLLAPPARRSGCPPRRAGRCRLFFPATGICVDLTGRQLCQLANRQREGIVMRSRWVVLGSAVCAVLCGASALGFDLPDYDPISVKATLKPYAVSADLKNVSNLSQYGELSAKQRELLAKNAFFVAPSDHKQLHWVYEQNDYIVIPSFITSDTVLHLYHVFYDYTLRQMEAAKLLPICKTLTANMLKGSVEQYKSLSDENLRTAALKNIAYFSVALRCMDLDFPVAIPREAYDLAQQELAKIKTHPPKAPMAIFPYELHYSQFIVRGHYTRTEDFKRYFKAMMWYGLVPIAVHDPSSPPNIPKPLWEQIRQSLLITKLLFFGDLAGKPPIETWERLYEPTVFYVESSDDFTPHEWCEMARPIFGEALDEGLEDRAKLRQLYDRVRSTPKARIATDPLILGLATGPQLRFMGQRYVPDSYVFQQLVFTRVGVLGHSRDFPKGLDAMAVLGSARADEILHTVYKEHEYLNYDKQLAKMKAEFGPGADTDWRKNLYWGWLWSLKSILRPWAEGYPSFMRHQAWTDKDLYSALASWTELRHDTILYVKQSVTVECGGDEQQPPVPKGYVEPAVELYNRLIWLTEATQSGLNQRDLLTPAVDEQFKRMSHLLHFLRDVSVKELTGTPLTPEEYNQIRVYGSDVEYITQALTTAVGQSGGALVSDADEDMAVVADVHTGPGGAECLEEGMGHAGHIYVVVPVEGKLVLTRGAVMSYYEFIHPATDRLTDEKWQEMLNSGEAPPPPEWTESFLTDKKSKIPTPRVTRSTGC